MFMLLKVPRGSIEEELALVCRELEEKHSSVYVPRLFLKLALETIRITEKTFNLDCGPTVGMDIAFSARSRAQEDERAIAGWQDMCAAMYTTVVANSRQQGIIFPEESFGGLVPDVAAYLQRELTDIDLACLISFFQESLSAKKKISSNDIKKIILLNSTDPILDKFSAWVMKHEKIANFRIYEVITEYVQTYRTGIAELKKARGRMSN